MDPEELAAMVDEAAAAEKQQKQEPQEEDDESPSSLSSSSSSKSFRGSTTSTSSTSSTVSFGSVEIITFPLKLGDNPGGMTGGAPLTIGWKPTSRHTYGNVKEYESTRKGKRRRGKKLVMPAVEREVHLLGVGYHINQIVEAAEKTDKARRERIKSYHNKKWDKFAFHMESAFSKIKLLPSFAHTTSTKSSSNNKTSSLQVVGDSCSKGGTTTTPEQQVVSATTA